MFEDYKGWPGSQEGQQPFDQIWGMGSAEEIGAVSAVQVKLDADER